MEERSISTYRAFWPVYVNEHQNKHNRMLHFAGTALVLVSLFLGLAESPWFFFGVPVFGNGPAWLGHYFFERNFRATLRHPLWSLVAEFQMFALMCLGRMDREVKRMGVLNFEPRF